MFNTKSFGVAFGDRVLGAMCFPSSETKNSATTTRFIQLARKASFQCLKGC